MEEKDTTLRDFLWNLAGFKKEVVVKKKLDSYHASIIGTLLLIVGIYATLAWTFFFQTVSQNPLIPIIAGIFMGFYIVSFDRALIASMASGNSNIFSLGFRLILATLLGFFLAQPMILKFYQNDIEREAQILVDKKNSERKTELENLYKFEIEQLNAKKQEYQAELNEKKNIWLEAESDFKGEMDGSAGTGKWGYNKVSIAKENVKNNHRDEYNSSRKDLEPKINSVQNEIDEINSKISNDFEEFKESNNEFGTLVQAEALESLLTKDKSGSLRLRYYLLSFILALIELSALIAKMFFRNNSYKSEVSFITEEEVKRSENDKEISLGKLEEYKTLTMENELELIRRFFTETKSVNEAKLDELIEEWKNKGDGSYKELYELFKQKFIIHD